MGQVSWRRRAYALSRLATLYARHVARRAVHRPAPGEGLRAFDALYRPDRVTAVTPEERAELPRHGRCVACGLCGMAAGSAGYARPERLALQLTRTLTDLWVVRDLDLDGVDWEAAQAVCPLGVPLAPMRATVRDRLARDGVEPPTPRGLDLQPGGR